MANLGKMAAREPVRMLVVGFPGAGKTGSLASLANMGYKLRILGFDKRANITAPLMAFVKPQFLGNIDIINFENKFRVGAKTIETSGLPEAFANGMKMMDRWKYKDEDGTEIDLGQSKDWGCDTIVVLDSLTSMGDAAFLRIMSMLNKTPLNFTQQGWGIAMGEQEKFIEKMVSGDNKFHVIVLSHLKMIGPKEAGKDADDTAKDIAERKVELIPTRYFPSALGQGLAPLIGRHFPTVVEVENRFVAGRPQKVVRTVSRPDLDLKLPSLTAIDGSSIDTAMAKIFDAIAPPLSSCLGSSEVATSTEKEKS